MENNFEKKLEIIRGQKRVAVHNNKPYMKVGEE